MAVTVAVIVMIVSVVAAVSVIVASAVIIVVFVLAVVVPIIVPDFVVVLVSTPVIFPAPMASPVSALTAPREGAAIAVVRVEIVVDVAVKSDWTVEPGSGAEEYSTHEPLRAVIAEGRALIRRVVEVAVRADWLGAYLHVNTDLR